MDELTILIDAANWNRGLAAPAGAPAKAVHVRWRSDSLKLGPEAAAHVEQRWAIYLAEAHALGKSLFDGPVSRLISATLTEGEIELCLGPADYKSFLVTCLRDRAWFLARAPEAITPALGSSALITHGDRALLGIRSPRVSAYASRAHLLGGVVERLDTGQFSPDVAGLVAHLRLELWEEAAVTSQELSSEPGWPRLLGVVQDKVLGQPEAVWQWEMRASLEAVGSRLHAREHSGWLALTRKTPDAATWNQMTPVARHAWRIWSTQ